MTATQMDIEVERDGELLIVTVDASDAIGGVDSAGVSTIRIVDGRRFVLRDGERREVELTDEEMEEANDRWPDVRTKAIEDARWGHL